ncbi:MAG: hypothetical protein AAB505_01005 [Patescibacteria group bacterium]
MKREKWCWWLVAIAVWWSIWLVLSLIPIVFEDRPELTNVPMFILGLSLLGLVLGLLGSYWFRPKISSYEAIEYFINDLLYLKKIIPDYWHDGYLKNTDDDELSRIKQAARDRLKELEFSGPAEKRSEAQRVFRMFGLVPEV